MEPSVFLFLLFVCTVGAKLRLVKTGEGVDFPQDFDAPAFSRFIGNKPSWDCNNSQFQIVFPGADQRLCDSDVESFRNALVQRGVDPTVSGLFLTEQILRCPHEQTYENAELLGFKALFNVRNDIPGEGLNVHNRGQLLNSGGIPFLEIGFAVTDFIERELKNASRGDFVVLDVEAFIDGCDDESVFEVAINKVQATVFAFDGVVALIASFMALRSWLQLKTDESILVYPRKVALVIDGSIMLVLGILLFTGMIRDRCHSWMFGNDNVADDVKLLFVRQFAFFQLFTTYMAALYWELMKKLSLQFDGISEHRDFFKMHKWRLVIAFMVAFFLELFEVSRRLAYASGEAELTILDVTMLLGILYFAGRFYSSSENFLEQTKNARLGGKTSLKNLDPSSIQYRVLVFTRHMTRWLRVYVVGFIFTLLMSILLVIGRQVAENASDSPIVRLIFYWGTSLSSKVMAISKIKAMSKPRKRSYKSTNPGSKSRTGDKLNTTGTRFVLHGSTGNVRPEEPIRPSSDSVTQEEEKMPPRKLNANGSTGLSSSHEQDATESQP